MPVEACTLAVSDSCLRFGERKNSSISRPFGVALLIAGVDENGPQLWMADPSGTYLRYEAKAIGEGMKRAQQMLEEQYHKSLTIENAEDLALGILKSIMEEKIRGDNCEIACIPTSTRKLEIYSVEQIEKILARLN